MITNIQVTLECEVCGAGWTVAGALYDFTGSPLNLRGEFAGYFFADKPPVCPGCGEEDAWAVAKPEGIQ